MFYSESEVKQVDVSTTAGSFGILPSHVPTLATLRPGLLTVHDEAGAHKYFGKLFLFMNMVRFGEIPP